MFVNSYICTMSHVVYSNIHIVLLLCEILYYMYTVILLQMFV